MAEIDIEKKKPVWPWVLLGIVILALILFLVFTNDDDTVDDFDDTNTELQDTIREDQMQDTTQWNDTLTGATTGEISTYLAHVGDTTRMGVDHQYTNNALIHLVNAVESKAREVNYDISENITRLQQDAERITQNPQSTDHANQIKETGSEIVEIMNGIQEENYPELSNDVQEVKSAVENIDTSEETLQQRERITTFFNEAAEALRKMN